MQIHIDERRLTNPPDPGHQDDPVPLNQAVKRLKLLTPIEQVFSTGYKSSLLVLGSGENIVTTTPVVKPCGHP